MQFSASTTQLLPLLLPLLSFFTTTTVVAEKDSSYYPGKYSNPNVNRKMYWRDAPNVLQDLDQFSKLYITYHNCAWSPYGEEGEENPCGVEQAEDDAYWYMGYTECFRANAAYSLYGILKNEEDKGCTRNTFINSFFTTMGVEELTEAIQAAGFSFSSGSNNNDDNEEEGDDGNYVDDITSECQADEDEDSSYGLGCSAENFVYKTFGGAYCNNRKAKSISDKLVTFNSDLKNIDCFPIYKSTSNGQNNNNNEEGEDGQDNEGDNGLDLLTYSKACDVSEYPKQCPDPHGKLRLYSSSLGRSNAKASHPRRELIKTIVSWVLLIIGILLILGALSLIVKRIARHNKKKNANNSGSLQTRKKWFNRNGQKTGDAESSDHQASRKVDKQSNRNGNESRPSFFKRIRTWGRKGNK